MSNTADRVKETTATTGTGTVTLAGAVTGYRSFSQAVTDGHLTDGDKVYYTLTDATNWEVGVGVFTVSGTTLSRDTILSSSNAGSAVSFSAGSKDVWCDIPARSGLEKVGHIVDWPGLDIPDSTWDWCDGGTLSRTTYAALFKRLMKQSTVTMTIASPCVVTWTAHGLRTNHPVRFFTTGSLPTGITAGTHGGPVAGTQYFVKKIDANSFNVALIPGGTSVNSTGSQSGVQTCVCAPHGSGDGTTTFHKPDLRGRVTAGRDDMAGSAAGVLTVGGSAIYANVPGRSGGAETVVLTTSQLASHVHGVNDPTHSHLNTGGGANFTTPDTVGNEYVRGAVGTGLASIAYSATGVTLQSTGSDAAHQNTQPSFIVDKIIKIL